MDKVRSVWGVSGLGKGLSGGFARALLYGLIFVPAAFGFLFVHLFAVNTLVSDDWDLVENFRELYAGTLTLGDIFAFHNVHRIFFPRLVMLSLGYITEYNTISFMYVTAVCFLITLVVFLLVFRSNVRASLIFFLPIAFLVFSPAQYTNMLQGFNMNHPFSQAFSILAFFLIFLYGRGRFGRLAFAGAIGSATVAAFSSLQGLIVWPAGLLQLLIGPSRRTKKFEVGVWTLFGVVEWIVYFIGYSSTRQTSLFYPLTHPRQGIDYFLTLLGSSLFWEHAYAFVFGALLLCLAAVSLFLIYRSGRLSEYSFWVTVFVFSLLSLGLIGAGRTGYSFVESGTGIASALAPRYTTLSILMVISIYAMLVKLAAEQRSLSTVAPAGVLSGIILLTLPVYYVYGIEQGNEHETQNRLDAFILATYQSQPDRNLRRIFPDADRVRNEIAPTLEELEYNVFSEREQVLPPKLSDLSPDSFSIQFRVALGPGGKALNEQTEPVVISGAAPFMTVSGWAVDSRAESAAGGVYINVDGELFPALYGVRRSDAADRLGETYENSGFSRAIPTSEIGPGLHKLSIVVISHNQERYRESERFRFRVTANTASSSTQNNPD